MAEILFDHQTLTHLLIGYTRIATGGRDRELVRASLPNVVVYPAMYNEFGIMRMMFGGIFLLMFSWLSLNNLSAHFSIPQSRVVPGYQRPHRLFALGYLITLAVIATAILYARDTISWFPAAAASTFFIAIGALMMTNMSIWNISHQRIATYVSFLLLPILFFYLVRPLIRAYFPMFECGVDIFLMRGHPAICLAIIAGSGSVIWALLRQFLSQDRLYAENALEPVVTANEFGKQTEVLAYRRGEHRMEKQLELWKARLASAAATSSQVWRKIKTDWLGEFYISPKGYASMLVMGVILTFVFNHGFPAGSEFALVYLQGMSIGLAVLFPLMGAFNRQDCLGFELLHPDSRGGFFKNRMVSIATKIAILCSVSFLFSIVLNYVSGRSFDVWVILRSAVMLVAMSIAGTGLLLWMLSIRRITALLLLAVVALTCLFATTTACIDFRWVMPGSEGEQANRIVAHPLFFIIGYAVATLLLWTGFNRLKSCELARQ